MNFKSRLGQLEEVLSSETLPEITINYKVNPTLRKDLKTPKERADFIRGLFDEGTFDLQEQVVVLILDHEYRIFGYFKHSMGTMDAANVDARLIFQKLLVVGGTNFIVAHNHPVAEALPSQNDTDMTFTLDHKARFLDLTLVDHIILNSEGYYSYDEQGFL